MNYFKTITFLILSVSYVNCVVRFFNNLAVYEGSSNFKFKIDLEQDDNYDFKGTAFGVENDEYKLISDQNGVVSSQQYRYRQEGSGKKWEVIFTQPTQSYENNLYFDLHTNNPITPGTTLVTRGAVAVLCKQEY